MRLYISRFPSNSLAVILQCPRSFAYLRWPLLAAARGPGYGGTGVSFASIQIGLSIMQRQFLYFLYTAPFEQIWVFKFVGCNTQIPADWPIINYMCAHFDYLRWA